MSERLVFFNDRIIPASEASISISDPAFLHGASVFTTMLAHNGVIFRFDQHLKRMADQIRLLGLQVEATVGKLIDGMYEVLDENDLSEARCRITLTPGAADATPVTLITADPLPQYPAAWYQHGISVVVSTFKQFAGDPLAGCKTGCYLSRILARQEAAARGAEDAIWFTTDNLLAETCFSNIFLVMDGEVRTPPKGTPVLPGITRDAMFDICSDLEISCEDDQRLTVDDMLQAREVFLTSSTMGVRPVSMIEKHQVGNGKPGGITLQIMEKWKKLIDTECNAGRRILPETGD